MPATHFVLLPTYNTGPRLRAVVTEVLRHWQPVLVVVDGSTDASEQMLAELARTDQALHVLVLPRNGGKGAAVLAGAKWGSDRGFTHALVMDADGQHPAGSIGEFMAVSQARPKALVLGRPIFPPNIPSERLHGRKLSVGLVWLELLGGGIDDPLFGFRVYPLGVLLAALGSRRSGRRYDFDTEAAVRLAWAGVPLVNLPAPVRYFSRAEGGVSHFHYLRDNATLVTMHTRLVVELVFWRWPALLRHRREWRRAVLLMAWCLAGASLGSTPTPLVEPAGRLPLTAPAWPDLTDAFAHNPDITANFTERRRFPFRKESVVLTGEVRVSPAHGLSLHYLTPDERTIIVDERGMLIRTAAGQKIPPADPRAAAANEALLQILRCNLAALAKNFELFGRRDGVTWELELIPRAEAQAHGVGRILAAGESATIRRIEIRRTEKQVIEIDLAAPRSLASFTPDELREFFR